MSGSKVDIGVGLLNDAHSEIARLRKENAETAAQHDRLLESNAELAGALKYARRFLEPESHDTAFVDAALANATPNTDEAGDG